MKNRDIKTDNLANRTKTILPIVTILSGIAALIYESLWMRSFSLIFGNTTNAITLILTTYMGGIAFGSYLATKFNIKDTLKAYVYVEIGIGITALLTYLLLKLLPGIWGSIISDHQLPVLELVLRILVTSIIVFMPTILLGTTMPFLVKELSYYKNSNAVLSQLYSLNTLGGAAGVLLSTFLLLPAFGMLKTYLIAVGINLLIALFCYKILTSKTEKKLKFYKKEEIEPVNEVVTNFYKKFWIASFITAIIGATSFGLEILLTRSFVLVIGSSVYAFGIMLFTILLGIVAGSWLYSKFKNKIKNEYKLISVLLPLICVFILLSSVAIGRLPIVYLKLMNIFPSKFFVHQFLGFFLCFTATFLITIVFGFAFPLVFNFSRKMSERIEPLTTSARLYAWNTIGAISGSLVTGFLLIPFFGIQKSFVIVASFSLIAFILLIFLNKQLSLIRKSFITLVLSGIIFLLFNFWMPWDKLIVTSGVYKNGLKSFKENKFDNLSNLLKHNKKILFYEEGSECVVAVVETNKHRYFSVNGKTDGGTSDVITQKLLSYLPLGMHSNPKSTFIIGWGTGCTAGAAGKFPLESIDVAEIEPALIKCQPLFKQINNDIYNDPRLNIIINDARNILLTSAKKYDVIISEPSNPWISGVSNLFTKDFYDIVKSRLNEDGIFCQWFHIYDMSPENIKSQINTFCSVFPVTSLWATSRYEKTDIFLLGSKNSVNINLPRIDSLFKIQEIKEDMLKMGIENPISFISNEVLNHDDMRAFCRDAKINTDDNILIEANAPKTLFNTDFDPNLIYDLLQKFDNSILPSGIIEEEINSKMNRDSVGLFYTTLGEEYFKKNFIELSSRALRKAIKYNENIEKAAILLGQISVYNANLEEAKKWYNKSVSLNPSNLESWNQLAIILYQMNQLENAKKVNQQIMKLFPKNADGAIGIGITYYKEGNLTKAAEYLKMGLNLEPDNKLASKTLKQIEHLSR